MVVQQAIRVFEQEPHWRELTVAELISRQARLAPQTPAIVSHEQTLTYQQVEAHANQLAHFLQQQGIGPETVVALWLERGVDAVDQLITQLAAWKAGGAFVILDPSATPLLQMHHILSNGQVRLLLTKERLRGQLALEEQPLVCLDTAADTIRAYPMTVPVSRATPESLAYLISTSGSTGAPKGVLVEHRWLPSLAHEQIALFGVQPGERLSHLLAPSFDASLSEIVTCWLAGATLYPAPADALRPGPHMVQWLEEQQISLAHFTPSVLAALPDAALPALRTLVIGGETCPIELAMRHHERGRQVIPVYGLTETTVCTFGYRYPGDGSPVSLGQPFSYVTAAVWDEQDQPVAPGTPGQIVLAGPLARGYTAPEQTAERFIECGGQRWCLTGDYGAQQPDGTYRYLGRQDAQHKVSGYLLNLAQVEATLRAHPAVRDAKAFLHADRWVIAYVVLQSSAALRVSELRAYLTPRLPAHALPACCLMLDALPLTEHGKVSTRPEDYPEPTAADYQHAEEVFQPPETEAERELAAIIQRQTEHPFLAQDPQQINILLTLEELGIDSLGLVGVELEIAEHFHVTDLTESQLTTWPVFKLAQVLSERLQAWRRRT